jgi:hypothetical protein
MILAAAAALILLSPHLASSESPTLALSAGGQVAKFIVLSEKEGEQKFHVNETKKYPEKFQRNAVKYSPLAWYLPERWVPVVASAIGAFLISLVHQFISLGQSFVESLISDKKKAKVKLRDSGIKVLGIKVREVFAVMAAAFVLGAAISWTYAGPTDEFLWLLGVNFIICLMAGLSHEAVHRIAGKLLGIKSEYTFWFSGAFLTIVTALLGNAFGLQGMLVDEIKEGTDRRKIGLMKLSGSVFSFGLMVLAAACNLLYPSFLFQMVGGISGMVAMADILPFKPMDGYEIRRWNFLFWLVWFMTILVTFTAVSFVL